MYKFSYLLIFSLLLNLVLLPILLFMSMKNTGRINDYFNPNLSVTVKALSAEGFKYSPKESMYVKTSGDTSFFYNATALDASKIYRRSIGVKGATDSLRIVQWVSNNKGFICSDWAPYKSGRYFFVKGLTSGLISECRADAWGLVVFLDYPYEEKNLDELRKLREY